MDKATCCCSVDPLRYSHLPLHFAHGIVVFHCQQCQSAICGSWPPLFAFRGGCRSHAGQGAWHSGESDWSRQVGGRIWSSGAKTAWCCLFAWIFKRYKIMRHRIIRCLCRSRRQLTCLIRSEPCAILLCRGRASPNCADARHREITRGI